MSREELEIERNNAIAATKEECKEGGSRSKAIAFSNLAIVYQMRIDNLDAADRERWKNI